MNSDKILGRFNFFSKSKDNFCVMFYDQETNATTVVAKDLEFQDANRLMRNLNHQLYDMKSLLEEFEDEVDTSEELEERTSSERTTSDSLQEKS